MSEGHVVFVCPPKALTLDRELHRADHLATLHALLEQLRFAGNTPPQQFCYLPGGGMAADPDVDMCAVDTCMACFKGRLDNAAFLTRQYFEEELEQYGYGEHVPLAILRQYPPFPPSALICKLYMRFGPRFLHRLRGHWSFICYDSVTMRVFAARESYGEPMWLGKLANYSIFASFGGVVPPNTVHVQELLPGFFKYGWHGEPLQFAASPAPVEEIMLPQEQVQQGVGEEPPPSPKKKTRRGVRAGRKRHGHRTGTSPPVSPRVSFDSGSDGESGLADAAFDDYDDHGPTPSFSPFTTTTMPAPSRGSLQQQRSVSLDIPRTIVEEHGGHSSEDEHGERAHPRELPETLRQHLDPSNCDPASLRLLHSMLYKSPCALTVTDAGQPDHPIVFVNAAFTMQTGYTAEECIGQNCRFLQAPPEAERVPCFASTTLRKALEAGTRSSVRILNYRSDGVPLMNALSIVPLRSKDGTITHFIGMQAFTCVDDVAPPAAVVVESTRVVGGLSRQFGRTGSIRSKSKSCNDLAGIATRDSARGGQGGEEVVIVGG